MFKHVCELAFGAYAQIAVGGLFFIVTLFQGWLWGVHADPGSTAIFWISIEALLFAAYGVMAVGFGMIWLDKRTPSG